MTELIDFLNARLDEDEQIAKAAQGQEIFFNTSEDAERFMRRWRSGRVLADITAKRAIVRHEDLYGEDDTILRLLASVYADHPDFEEVWRIDVSAATGGEHPV